MILGSYVVLDRKNVGICLALKDAITGTVRFIAGGEFLFATRISLSVSPS
jgi:hypothetical protein